VYVVPPFSLTGGHRWVCAFRKPPRHSRGRFRACLSLFCCSVYHDHMVGQIALVNVANTTNTVSAVAVSGNYAYVVGAGLWIYDVSNPANPIDVGYNSYGGIGVAVFGHYAYVASFNYGLLVIDASNPANPTLVGGDNNVQYASYVAVSGHFLYLTESGGVDIYDLSNSPHPARVAQISDGYANGGTFRAVTVSDNYLYVANGGDGLGIHDVSNPPSPINVGYVPDYDGGFGYAVRVAVSGHYAYLANTRDGLRIYDVSNPAIPVNIGYINNGGDRQLRLRCRWSRFPERPTRL
jgi:hypothetical protein